MHVPTKNIILDRQPAADQSDSMYVTDEDILPPKAKQIVCENSPRTSLNEDDILEELSKSKVSMVDTEVNHPPANDLEISVTERLNISDSMVYEENDKIQDLMGQNRLEEAYNMMLASKLVPNPHFMTKPNELNVPDEEHKGKLMTMQKESKKANDE